MNLHPDTLAHIAEARAKRAERGGKVDEGKVAELEGLVRSAAALFRDHPDLVKYLAERCVCEVGVPTIGTPQGHLTTPELLIYRAGQQSVVQHLFHLNEASRHGRRNRRGE